MEQTAAAHSQAVHFQSEGYGLRRGVLSPMETLAQSVSTIAPTTTPAATIPLVCALAGNGTWLAYLLATMAVLLALVGNLYPVPEGPYGRLPFIYLAFLIVGLFSFFITARGRKVVVTVQN